MNCEYNGNKLLNERIDLVANDIISFYKDIDINVAKKIALLEEPIIDDYNKSMHFKRLYNILLFIQNDKELFNRVLVDLKNVYIDYKLNPNSYENLFDSIVFEINRFTNKERIDFPVISEFI